MFSRYRCTDAQLKDAEKMDAQMQTDAYAHFKFTIQTKSRQIQMHNSTSITNANKCKQTHKSNRSRRTQMLATYVDAQFKTVAYAHVQV